MIVGGLGLGHTAKTALDDERVTRLQVIETLPQVIGWHRAHLVPLGATLTADDRCTFVHGDFFAMVADGIEQSTDGPTRFDAILVDIDHTPSHLLSSTHASFYRPAGARPRPRPTPAGWRVRTVVGRSARHRVRGAPATRHSPTSTAHVVAFPNFYTGGESACTVFATVARGRVVSGR